MKAYSPSSVVYNRKNWRYALNVRHPFEKIYSAWKDKMNTKKVYYTHGPYQSHASEAIKFETKNDKFKPEGYACSFESFLEFLAHNPKKIGFNHYIPVTGTCSLCEINYTDMTQQESLTDDALKFFEETGSDQNVKFLKRLEGQDLYALKKYPTSAKATG